MGGRDLQTLLDIEEIRRLKARRVRCLDLKDWEGYGACHTPDAETTVLKAEGFLADATRGPQDIVAMARDFCEGKVTAHHLHEPEIELTSDTTAKGIWPMEDNLWWEENGQQFHMHGYGHYHETYQKLDGRWLIKTRTLTRVRVTTTSSSVRAL